MVAVRWTLPAPLLTLLTLLAAPPPTESWVSEALAEAMSGFSASSDTNPQCSRDGDLYRRALDNQTLWAVTMLDASSGWAGGLLTGDAYSMGHFDQCVSVKRPLRAQHCLATLTFGPLPSVSPAFYGAPPNATYREPSPYASVWDKIKVTSDTSVTRRDRFHWAVCVPHSCDADDVRHSLNASLAPALARRGLRGEVLVDAAHCHDDPDDGDAVDGENFTGYVAVRVVILLAVLVSAIATVYDYVIPYCRDEKIDSVLVDKSEKLLLAFSIRKNMNELTEKGANPRLDVVNGGKVISMAAILFGHRALYSHGLSLQNQQYWELRLERFWDNALLNGTHLVDLFFTCSGFLAFLGIHKAMEKTNNTLNFPLVVLLRWLRIVPAYMLMMAVYGWLLPHLSEGPLWTERVGQEAERCRQNWWLNLLFVNNYVHADKQCLLFSWYLACDMQFFVFGLFAVYVLVRWPRPGYLLFALLLALSVAVPFYVTYDGQFSGILKLYPNSLLREPLKNEQFTRVYVKSHNRAGPYVIGLFAGFLGVRLTAANYRFNKRTILLGFLLLFVGGYAHQFHGFLFYQKDREYIWQEHALFASLHRISFGLGVGWIVLTHYTTGFGLYRVLFCQPIYAPLSRLVYCVLLVHPAIQLAEASSVRHTEFMTYPKMFWMACGDYLMSTLAALPLYLMVEAPCRNVVKVLFLDRTASPTASSPSKAPETSQTADQPKQVVVSRL